MQEDFVARMIDMLRVAEPRDEAAALDADERAYVALQVVMTYLHSRVGRDQALSLVGEALDNAMKVQRDRTMATLAATPAVQLAETLIGYLRQNDPAVERQAVAAHDDAGAMILAGVAFLQERHGSAHAAGYTANIIRVLQEAVAAGEEPVSAPAKVAPIMPPPAGIRAAAPNPRAGLTLSGRVNVMCEFLRGSTPADARDDALASLMASALFLRERFSEPYAVGAIRQVEGTVSQAAALDRWQPEGAAAN